MSPISRHSCGTNAFEQINYLQKAMLENNSDKITSRKFGTSRNDIKLYLHLKRKLKWFPVIPSSDMWFLVWRIQLIMQCDMSKVPNIFKILIIDGLKYHLIATITMSITKGYCKKGEGRIMAWKIACTTKLNYYELGNTSSMIVHCIACKHYRD